MMENKDDLAKIITAESVSSLACCHEEESWSGQTRAWENTWLPLTIVLQLNIQSFDDKGTESSQCSEAHLLKQSLCALIYLLLICKKVDWGGG